MVTAVEGLKPELVWKYFVEIAKIPHGSKNETALAKFVVDMANKLGLNVQQDTYGNVVVRKPASPGRESVRSICLQGHLDMVCEKNTEKVHDFLKDPIELVRNGNVIMANGTTLGADNGIAVATNLAMMEDKSLEHGPLEFLFTVDEETGLTGATNLSQDFLVSRTLMNLDSEEEGALYVGCSGGKDTTGTWKAEFENSPPNTIAAKLSVKGLKGGHSGLDIDKGRGNALKILVRVLLRLVDIKGRIVSLTGGNKRNAIPREAEANLFLPKKWFAQAQAIVSQMNETIKSEFATVEPELQILLSESPTIKKGKVLKRGLQKKILDSITALPHGVIKMSPDIPGLVETSTNVAVLSTDKKAITLATSQRSSVASEIFEIAEMVATVFKMGGASVKMGEGYPGWKPNMNSEILQVSKSTYMSMYGKEPHVKAVHAGLECGIIGEKFQGMDMVSLGPTLEAVHSPDEKIYVDSVEKFWNFLLSILKNVK
jgi:dipeptidase D